MAGPQQIDIYQYAARALADARFATITDNTETQFVMTDAWPRAVAFVLGQAPWRFALKTAVLATTTPTIPPFSTAYGYPADWLRTHAIYLLSAVGRECPLDLREQGTLIYASPPADDATVLMRYVSSIYADPSVAAWPEHFAQCVGVYLAFLVAERVTGERSAPVRMSEMFSSLMSQGTAIDAVSEDPWLAHQRSGTFFRTALAMTDEAFWRFALKTANITVIAGAGDGGLANKFAIPGDWSRTRSLYQLASDGKRCPFDVREVGGFWHTNATSFYAQYLSQTLAIDATQWPDHYLRAVLRAIEQDIALRRDSEQGPPTYGRDYQLRADQAWKESLAAVMDSEADMPDRWLSYQLDGSFDRVSRAVIARGNWTFPGAMKTVDIDTSTQEAALPTSGFPYRYPLPSDWFQTCALYVAYDGQEHPINIRQDAEDWSTDVTAFTARYISTAALNATMWPEIVSQAVLAYLDWQAPSAQPAQQGAAPKEQTGAVVFAGLLKDALDQHSVADDDWLRFQLSGQYRQAIGFTLEKGRWRFAIKTVRLETENDPGNATIALSGTVSGGDVLSVEIGNGAIAGSPVTVSVTANSNDTLDTLASRLAGALGANAALAAAGITASMTVVDVNWITAYQQAGLPVGSPAPPLPAIGDPVVNVVLTQVLNPTVPDAVVATAQPGGGNVQYTLTVTGAQTEVMTLGVYSGPSPSVGYTYRFPKPNDLIRVMRLWYSMEDGSRPIWFDVDYRDEAGYFHTNFFPVNIRYVSRDGLNATCWPANFRDAVLAWLQHVESRGDPKTAAVAAARLKFFEQQLTDAESLDDAREVPQVRTGGRLTRGRYGRGTLDIEQALPPFVPL